MKATLFIFFLFGCTKNTLPEQRIIPILFMGQSNMVYRHFVCDVDVPYGYALAFNGTTNKYSITDWTVLPDTSFFNTNLMMKNEGTLVPPFIIQFHDQIHKKLSVVRYGASGSTYNNWRDTIAKEYTAYATMKRITDSFLKGQSMIRSDLQYIIMYLGESDGFKINFDSMYKVKSLNDLYILVDQFHNDFSQAKILIIETSYPAGQSAAGMVRVRKEQEEVSMNRNFVYIIDSTTKYYPRSWSSDGLHLNDSAYDHMAEEVVKNIKKLFY